MGNKYRTTISSLSKIINAKEEYKQIINDIEINEEEKIKLILLLLLQEMRTELIDLGRVSINKFGSFSISLRLRGNYFVKFFQSKQIKDFIKENIKQNPYIKSLTNVEIKLKIATNEIGLETIVNIVFKKLKKLQYEPKQKDYIYYVIQLFFQTIEEEVYKFNTVNILNFGKFYLSNNAKFGLYFKFTTCDGFKKQIDILVNQQGNKNVI